MEHARKSKAEGLKLELPGKPKKAVSKKKETKLEPPKFVEPSQPTQDHHVGKIVKGDDIDPMTKEAIDNMQQVRKLHSKTDEAPTPQEPDQEKPTVLEPEEKQEPEEKPEDELPKKDSVLEPSEDTAQTGQYMPWVIGGLVFLGFLLFGRSPNGR